MSGYGDQTRPLASASGGSGGKAAFGHDYLSTESYEHSCNRKPLYSMVMHLCLNGGKKDSIATSLLLIMSYEIWVKDIVDGAIKHEDYVRIENKSSAKSIFDSMCATYDGNDKVQEAKASLLIRQYELFTMEKDEDIETMFTRFQTLVFDIK
ncbi:aspartyl-tRNA synthetase, partial [Trifolium pratense]